ncbi:hypothetical protein RQP46_002374 [Phenoliferia psychrophenolica]
MKTFASLAALASLAVSVSAVPSAESGVAAIVCPSGSTAANASIRASYNANVPAILSVIGSFQKSAWQGLTIEGDSGPDNTVNSTRTAGSGIPGVSLVEEIMYIASNATNSEQVWRLANGPLALSPALNVTSYLEDVVLTSTCGGNSSEILWTAVICFQSTVVNASSVAGIFDNSHAGSLGNVSTILGLGNYTACGPNVPFVSSAAGPAATAKGPASTAAFVPTATATAGASFKPSSASGTVAPAATTSKSSANGVRATLAGGLLSLVGVLALAL